MASGYHLRTSFQGWSSLRTTYYLQSLSTSGSELPSNPATTKPSSGHYPSEISCQRWMAKGTNVHSGPTICQTLCKVLHSCIFSFILHNCAKS